MTATSTGTSTEPLVARAVFADAGGELRVREVRVAAPGTGEMRVRIAACGVCPAESAAWAGRRMRNLFPGHEPAAVVESVGPGVAAFRPGQRVFVHHHAPCGDCHICRRGDHVHCPTWRQPGFTPGAMAEHVLISAAVVSSDTVALPDALGDDAATLVEPLACVQRAWSRGAGTSSPHSVLVMGLGVMGLLHVAVGRSRKCSHVIAADRVPLRLEQARDCGATETVNVETEDLVQRVGEITNGVGADLVIVGPGTPEAMELGALCAATCGTVVLFSPLPKGQRWAMPNAELFFREVRVVPSYSAGPADTRAAVKALSHELAAVGKRLVTHRFPLDKWEEAFRVSAESAEAIQVVLHP